MDGVIAWMQDAPPLSGHWETIVAFAAPLLAAAAYAVKVNTYPLRDYLRSSVEYRSAKVAALHDIAARLDRVEQSSVNMVAFLGRLQDRLFRDQE